MVNRLFTLKSEREEALAPAAPTSEAPEKDLFADYDFNVTTVPLSESNFTDDERDFFGLPPRDNANDALGSRPTEAVAIEIRPPRKTRIIGAVLGITALATALAWGTKGQIDAERRKERIESCMNQELGPNSNIELVIDGQRGHIVVPEPLQPLFNECRSS